MKETFCPCGGVVQWDREKVVIKGKDFGLLEVGNCSECKSRYLRNKAMDMIESKLGTPHQHRTIYNY